MKAWPFVLLGAAIATIVKWPTSIIAGLSRILLVWVGAFVAWFWMKPWVMAVIRRIDHYLNHEMGGWMR